MASQQRAHRRATRPWFKKMRFVLPLVFVLSFVAVKASQGVGNLGTSDLASSPYQPSAESAAEARAESAVIGQKVRDGSFSFVVNSLQRPGRIIWGQSGTTESAQGEFVIIRVNVTNLGGEAKALTATGQFLVNDKGQRFAPSSAVMLVDGAAKIFRENINPGSTVMDAPLLFDVTPGTTITSIELHDSSLSKGVKVGLS